MNLLELFGNAEDAQDVPAGTTLFTEDAPGHLMYVILAGEVEVRVGGETVGVCGPGEMVGELSLIDHSMRSATAIARSDCCLAPVDEQRFLTLVQKTPAFAMHVMRELAEKLRRTNQLLRG